MDKESEYIVPGSVVIYLSAQWNYLQIDSNMKGDDDTGGSADDFVF